MKKYCLVCVAGMVMQGCAETGQAPAQHDFGVTHMPFQSRQEPEAAEIKVLAPKWLNDNRIRYRLLYAQPTRVRFYNLDQWVAPPPELLKLHLATANLDPSYSVVVHLLNFEQQFEEPGSAFVLLQFRAEVFSAGNKKILDSREFVLRSGKVSSDAEGAVEGFAESAAQASQQIQAWLRNLAQIDAREK
ncbi:MAG: ABC-type transport auxiliary lipoprotein family protein [Methylomicrobium sp.]